MKNNILILLMAFSCLAIKSNGQTILTQTFGSPTVPPALPATWTQSSTGSPAWHTSTGGTGGGDTWGTLTAAYNVPTTHGQFVIVDDAAYPPQLHDTLESPVFSLTGYTPADVFLFYDYFFYNATVTASGISETCVVVGSSDGGATWSVIDSVYGNAWYADTFSTAHVGLGSLSGSNCMIGFVYSDNGGSILGCALNNVIISVPPAGVIALTAISPVAPRNFFQSGSSVSFGGTMFNSGSTTITTFQATYQVGASAPVTTTFSSLSVAPFSSYNFICTPPYTPVATGSQSVSMWVTEIGVPGLADDSMSTVIIGVDSLQPKLVLIEDFNQASSDPVATVIPNEDTVYTNNLSRSIMLCYQVDFPGRDCMDSVTFTPFVGAMQSFYSITGVPDGQLDGSYIYPGAGTGYLNSDTVQAEAAYGSPFKITVLPSYDAATNTYSFTATLKCFADMPAGLILRAALAVDTLQYLANQSTETIPQTLFTRIAENMFPNASGTSLAAFTAGSTQTVTGSWVKNHPWGSDRAVWQYDSSSTGKIIVWVQNNSNQYVYQAGYAIVDTGTASPGAGAITGLSSVCAGGAISLSDTASGGVWSSVSTGIATVDASGIVTGVTVGTDTIKYTVTGTFGSSVAFTIITVTPPPAALSGIIAMCSGTTTILSDAVTGGTWSSSNTAVATVGLTSGIVTGISAGTSVLSYSLGAGCSVSIVFTVNPAPSAVTGIIAMCSGSTTILTDAVTGGTWGSSNTAVASIGIASGTVTGASPGTSVLSYSLSDGCLVSTVFTVTLPPSAITGIMDMCSGATTTLSDAVTGGTWSSSNTAVASVGLATGIVTGGSPGTSVLSYSLGAGCLVSAAITVNPSPSAVTGIMDMCSGSTTILSDATTGGTWSSSHTAVATVGIASGSVTGVSPGTSVLSYTLGGGCSASAVFTVTPPPSAVTGTMDACVGSTTTLSDAVTGGTWSSSNTSVANIGLASGIITGISPGTSVLSYSLGVGCLVTATITVNPSPSAMTGVAGVCMGSTTALSDVSPGGIWSSSNSSLASVTSGTVTGISVGTANITYRLPAGCFTTTMVTVNPLPTPTIVISGTLLSTTIAYSSYQWFLGGAPISGATDATHNATVSGLYSVTVTDVNGCTGTSGGAHLTGVGVQNINSPLTEFSVYPNPTQDNITISGSVSINNVTISNALGQKVFSNVYNTNIVVVSLDRLPPGIYIVKINYDKFYKVTKE